MPHKHKHLIVIATGGSGGHIFPAQAFARCINPPPGKNSAGDAGFEVLFVSDKYPDTFPDELQHILRLSVSTAPFSGKSLVTKLMGLCRLGGGVLQMLIRFVRRRPVIAVGFGSYASVPVLSAAWLLRIPYIIHEQNAVMGLANRKLSKHAALVAVNFADTRHLGSDFTDKVKPMGNPVRPEFTPSPYVPARPRQGFRVLITGGSQGAQFFGERIPEAFANLPKSYRKRLKITQQVRQEQLSQTQKIYDSLDIDTDLSPFLQDMPRLLKETHLLIGRAGASTIAEAAAVGRPLVLIPLPNSVYDHQLINAQCVSDGGGAWMFTQEQAGAKLLSMRIREFMDSPEILQTAADNISKAFDRNAAESLRSAMLNLLGDGRQ